MESAPVIDNTPGEFARLYEFAGRQEKCLSILGSNYFFS